MDALRDRKYDFILARLPLPVPDEQLANELNIGSVIDDKLVIAAGTQHRWARRRRIDLAELVNEAWILTASHTWNYLHLAEAFRARGLGMHRLTLISEALDRIEERGIVQSRRRPARPEPEMPLFD